MLPQALLLMSLVSSGCFVQASRHLGLDNQNAATTSTVSSTELSTDIETSFRTSTRTTLSRHSVLETDASTMTTGTSERHTKISTYSSVPTTAITESLVSTSTVELIESTPPPVHISVTEPPVHVTVAPAKPKPTCCSYPSGAYPYIDSKIDTTCLDPLFRVPFARFHDPAINSAQFCAWSKSRLHDFFMTIVFDNVCYKSMDPEGNRARIAANEAQYISCFSGWMEDLCGFHIITNTEKEIDSICGRDW